MLHSKRELPQLDKKHPRNEKFSLQSGKREGD
jgi:hypothetical protein